MKEGNRRVARPDKGVVVWMTGLPGAGKSTLAQLVGEKMRKGFGQRVEILDGDEIRRGISRDLGFSREDREEHAHRVSYVAKLLARNGVVAIVALISPYRTSRAQAREVIGPDMFVEVYIKAPLAVCEQRDPKGLYAKARRGEINNMTGIQDPYEEPLNPDLTIDTSAMTADKSADELLAGLQRLGHLAARSE